MILPQEPPRHPPGLPRTVCICRNPQEIPRPAIAATKVKVEVKINKALFKKRCLRERCDATFAASFDSQEGIVNAARRAKIAMLRLKTAQTSQQRCLSKAFEF